MRNIQKNNIVVLGLGNPTLSDDAVGLLVVNELENKYAVDFPLVTFNKNYSGGFDLLYDLMNYKKALIIDSICTGKFAPGFCHEFSLSDIEEVSQPRLVDSHGLNLATVLDVGRECGYTMPDEIVIFGIEGIEFTMLSEKPSPRVLESLSKTVEKIKEKLYCLDHAIGIKGA